MIHTYLMCNKTISAFIDVVDLMSQSVTVCCGSEGDATLIPVDWLAVCGEGSAPVEVHSDGSTTTTTTSSGTASECCTSGATCPEGMIDTDIATNVQGQGQVTVCCSEVGRMNNLSSLTACSSTASTTDGDAVAATEDPSSAMAKTGAWTVAAAIAIVGTVLQL